MQHVFYLLLRRLRAPMITIVVIYSISVLGFVLIPGVDDEGKPWRMDFFHAFYFVSYMSTTIGFGEIPYPFTTPQRFWTVCTIYATVVGWLYSIGTIFALFQDPSFSRLTKRSNFSRRVRGLQQPFYLICGYGVTGSRLVHRLDEHGIQTVVLDANQNRIDALETDEVGLAVPALCGDAADPDLLNIAGIRRRLCAGVVALTNDDHTNLAVAIDSKLVYPERQVISRTESRETTANLASFGTDHIIDPFESFASYLVDALLEPYKYIIKDMMFNPHHKVLPSPSQELQGRWVVCGYGRFGKALESKFRKNGIAITFIEHDPDSRNAPAGTIQGVGTEAKTLLQADILTAVGIVAGTDNDADNLSIIITARNLKPDLITVARQNLEANKPVFRAARVNMIMEPGRIIADQIFVLIRTPLAIQFIAALRQQEEFWARQLLKRISNIIDDQPMGIWTFAIDPQQAPAIHDALQAKRLVRSGFLCRDPRDREQPLPALVLLIQRGAESMLLPDEDTRLQLGDEILIGGQRHAQAFMRWITDNHNVLRYVRSGIEAPGGLVWRWLNFSKRRRKKP
jgi:Trk K+ transport system NAD-binding subunit